MTFDETIAALQRRWPGVRVGNTANGDGNRRYYDKAIRITDYERVDDHLYIGHEPDGREMWVYFSERRNVICCGDKEG